MPLPLETDVTPLEPNSLYTPQIFVQCNIVDGKLKTSANIILSAANVQNAGTENETWTPAGIRKTIHIDDVEHLDADLSELQGLVNQAFVNVVTVVGAINNIRKIL